MLKFKIGDKVRVVENKSYHCFDIGTVGTIIKTYQNSPDPHYAVVSGHAYWYLGDDELIAYQEDL